MGTMRPSPSTSPTGVPTQPGAGGGSNEPAPTGPSTPVDPPEPHWSFVAPVLAAPPAVVDTEWAENGIDAFILNQLETAGLEPAPPAAPAALLRRVTLDLTGLPPSVEELDAFEADPSEAAYAAAVDRLLASPRYAEHMAAAWLDMARYSDTDGFQYDINRPAWPWRDWVLQALDSNLPYDQFITQQLAGDLLPDRTDDTVLATAFNRNHAIQGENGLLRNSFRDRYVTDRVETLGKAWLGLTLGCAKCHDHKYDPIAATDFFTLYDCFNQTDEQDNGPSSQPVPFHPVLGVDSPLAEQALAELDVRIEEQTAAGAGSAQLAELYFERSTLSKALNMRVMEERDTPRDTQVLAFGQYDAPYGPVLHCAAPAVLPAFPSGAPANRLGLAQWLTMPEHPLTARVTVNRFWLHHFGRGLVPSIDNFGVLTPKPELLPLLDWLAVTFVRSGWDVKAMHRLIVTSSTYRQDSSTTEETLAADPRNDVYARGPRHRWPAEVIRDLPLSVSGLLVNRLGGPPAYPYQPAGLWEELSWESNSLTYPVLTGDSLYRRSLYTFWKKTLPPPFMSLFDAPDREFASAYREVGITPLQALALLDDPQFIAAARVLAELVLDQAEGDVPTAFAAAFRRVTSRRPNETEQTMMNDLYTAQRAALVASAVTPLSEEEATLAGTAQVMRVLFNLSETITKE